jgi:hypothetical protein
MQTLGIPNVYIAVAAGIAIWWTGQNCGASKKVGARPSKIGKVLSWVGFAVFAAGMYAGFKGPLTVAGVTLGKFPFSRMIEQASAEALEYAKSSLDITREPAPGWHGASKTALQCTVRNSGDKDIGRISLRFSTANRSSVDLSLPGPFPAKRTTTMVMDVPSNVDRSYFNRAKVNPGEIVSARY